MVLAEALILRADTKQRIAHLQERLVQNAQVQEGVEPAENPQVLLAEINMLSAELTALVQQINRTNSATTLSAEQSLADALAARDGLQQRASTYRQLAKAATVSAKRYSLSEIRVHSTVDVTAIQATADQLAREHRQLDARIQALNWATELQS